MKLMLRPFIVLFLLLSFAQAQVSQTAIARVNEMADLPGPLKIIDWRNMALKFDSTVYNFNSKGRYWPLDLDGHHR